MPDPLPHARLPHPLGEGELMREGVAPAARRSRRRRFRPAVVLRLVLLGLSGFGMAAAAGLLITGHGVVAVPLLAGDVLLIFGLVIAAS